MNKKQQIRTMIEQLDKQDNLYIFNAKKALYIKVECEDVRKTIKEMLEKKEHEQSDK